MGLGVSTEDRERYKAAIGAHLYAAMQKAGGLPDVGIDQALLDNADLRPPVALQDSFKQLRKHVDAKGPGYLKELMAKLVVFTEEPQLMGLLTLVISMVMETAYASSRRPPPGMLVNGKVSELRGLIEEYLKRCRMHESEEAELREDTRRLEAQLSYQLTQIKGAILGEGPASSWALKHWVNGAVLHAQMLVQLARMDGRGSGPARAALAGYRSDLRELLSAYRRHKAATVYVSKCRGGPTDDTLGDAGTVTGYCISDKELGVSADVPLPDGGLPVGACVSTDSCAEAYLDHIFSHHPPIAGMERYFSETINSLLDPTGTDVPPPATSGQSG
ncbi:uncharacterized protein LOC125739461 [Brienomyrus brachyistius]|uniref:uncharacterized protein LOC125739461 n=1 Tax=Brienomyrus brachyistius TaxID=42636 RepID=UPI0020B2B906|nr:uncharacterized protein LOC125739461 [Brienomyrus brachyistius]